MHDTLSSMCLCIISVIHFSPASSSFNLLLLPSSLLRILHSISCNIVIIQMLRTSVRTDMHRRIIYQSIEQSISNSSIPVSIEILQNSIFLLPSPSSHSKIQCRDAFSILRCSQKIFSTFLDFDHIKLILIIIAMSPPSLIFIFPLFLMPHFSPFTFPFIRFSPIFPLLSHRLLPFKQHSSRGCVDFSSSM